MRVLHYLGLGLVGIVSVLSLSACDQSPSTLSNSEMQALVVKSKAQYQVCDVRAIALQISSGQNMYQTKYDTKYLEDRSANYSYYIAATRNDLNADQVRHIVCQYIRENSCYVYWGNIANIAMFADKKAPWFPGDSTPHYMLSPSIACNKM